MFNSIRTRLTLWYAGVLALSLIVFALIVYYAAAAIFHERQDESLYSTARTVASAYVEEFQEAHSLTKAGETVFAELIFPDRYVQITDQSGQPIASSRNATPTQITVPAPILNQARERSSSFVTINGFRVAVVPFYTSQDLGYAMVAEPVSVIDESLRQLRADFLAGVPIVLLLASAGGYFLARKSLTPIASMSNQTQKISAQNLGLRLDVSNPRDELGQLATTINELLGRLENAFQEQQRFVADASHELRTPLAVLRGETEVALTRTRTIGEYQDSLALIKDEAERLSRIVDDLFILAHQPIDPGEAVLREPVSLDRVVRDCVRAAQVLALRKGVRLESSDHIVPAVVTGDEDLLRRMLLNLLDNAVKYTPRAGEIQVNVGRRNGHAQIVVRDTGIGIPESAQVKVFDRFYRVDKERSRSLGGAGLGLSIVAWIVAAHGGQVSIDSTPGKGSQFTVDLPIRV